MGHGDLPEDCLEAVALFPLPNIVLFPRAVAPLHIFEERYKQMIADALDGSRLVAMALLRPGWQKNYYGRPPIDPVVCVGEILTHERLATGEYNLLLQGKLRAKIVDEQANCRYRIAALQPLPDRAASNADLEDARAILATTLLHPHMSRVPGIDQFRELAAGVLPVQELADLIAFHVFEDIDLKQSLLAETDVLERVGRTIAALDAIRASLPSQRPHISGNPSMN